MWIVIRVVWRYQTVVKACSTRVAPAYHPRVRDMRHQRGPHPRRFAVDEPCNCVIGVIPISCDKSRVLARQNAVSISQSFGDPEILGDLHRRPPQIKGAPNHRAVRGGQLRQRVSDQQSVDGGVHLVGTAGSGKSGESSELASLRNDERRLWSMIMLRTTVNSHARADRSPSSVTSECCHARSSVSCTRSSARTRSPVSRKA